MDDVAKRNKKKMGRPVVGEPKNIPLQLRMDKASIEKLDELCSKKNISRSELVRQLIKESK